MKCFFSPILKFDIYFNLFLEFVCFIHLSTHSLAIVLVLKIIGFENDCTLVHEVAPSFVTLITFVSSSQAFSLQVKAQVKVQHCSPRRHTPSVRERSAHGPAANPDANAGPAFCPARPPPPPDSSASPSSAEGAVGIPVRGEVMMARWWQFPPHTVLRAVPGLRASMAFPPGLKAGNGPVGQVPGDKVGSGPICRQTGRDGSSPPPLSQPLSSQADGTLLSGFPGPE